MSWNNSANNSRGRRNTSGIPREASQSRLLYLIPFVFLGLVIGLLIIAMQPSENSGANRPGPSEPEPQAPALNLEGFDPSYLISDEVFFDASTMSLEDIDQFINKWNEGCREGRDGAPCLADFKEDTPTWHADDFCPADFVGERDDTAASIIYKTAQACQVNPQVLLTTLQKEQGLITVSGGGLSETKYAIAMGYACPDGGRCDPKYQGFARQVYNAAHQFQMYRVQPWLYDVKAWEVNQIRYSPAEGCDGEDVYIENQATAGLYNYTPYVPTQATIQGSRERCSSWGNLNFYGFFQAWFGDPTP